MRFYRNHYGREDDEGESTGYSFFTSKTAALADAWEKTPWNGQANQIAVPIDVEPTKQGILLALNRWAAHPNNG